MAHTRAGGALEALGGGVPRGPPRPLSGGRPDAAAPMPGPWCCPRLPPPLRRPRRVEPVCSGLQAQILRCYREHLQEVLLCADLAKAYQHCVGSAHKVGVSCGLPPPWAPWRWAGRGLRAPLGHVQGQHWSSQALLSRGATCPDLCAAGGGEARVQGRGRVKGRAALWKGES